MSKSPPSPHAYQLRFSWTAWPSGSERFVSELSSEVLSKLKEAWESDGLRALECEWAPEKIRFLFSTRPEVAPQFLCQRAKGRLQHALRQQGNPVSFSRKVSCSSVEIVEVIRDRTGRAVGTQGLWMPTAYMGTYGEYGMAAVRKKLREEEGGS